MPPIPVMARTIALAAFAAHMLAQPALAQTHSHAEYEHRSAICQQVEDWLKPACLTALNEGTYAPKPSPAPQEPSSEKAVSFDELHLVGIYEAAERKSQDGLVHRGAVPIVLDRPGKSVVLALVSYEPVQWDITTTPGTSVSRILVDAYDQTRIQVTLNGEPARVKIAEMPLAYQSKGNRFQPYHEAAMDLTGAANADSFHGQYKAPKAGFTINSAPGLQTRQQVWDQLMRAATDRNTLSPHLRQALENAGASSPGNWQFGKAGFTGRSSSGEAVLYPLSRDMPRISWPVGAAYDPERQVLWGVTLGGEGFLYEYNIADGTWRARSMNNTDVGGLFFDPQADRLIATPGPYSRDGFLIMNRQGKIIQKIKIDSDAFPGLDATFDPGNGRAPAMHPIAAEGTRVMVRPKGNSSLVYLVDLNDATVQLIR